MKESKVHFAPYPEFKYDVRKSYEENYWKWKDMSDYEAKCECRKYYTEEEGKDIFRKMYGYHMPMNTNQSRLYPLLNRTYN